MDEKSTDPSDENVDRDRISDCLASVLSSDVLADSPRLRDILRYVVEEKLAGREDLIVGKAIAQSVYGRDIGKGHENDTNVRVDAGRLRKKLESYYSDQGRADAYRIDIPVGGYKPVFVRQADRLAGTRKPGTRIYQLIAIGASVFAGVVAALLVANIVGNSSLTPSAAAPEHTPATSGSDTRLEVERQAMFDKSPGSLEAYDLTQQARALIFPPLDPVRRSSALDLFERAIALDDSYYGSYAGAAQVLAFMAFVAPPSEASDALTRARSMAEKAKAIDPTRPWVQSALAWVAYVGRDYEDALVYSDRAAVLAPDDWLIMDFHSTITMLNGDFDKALEIAGRIEGERPSTNSVQRNVVAVSSFHLKRYGDTIESIESINATGGTSSPLTAIYLIAALQANGQQEAATKLMKGTRKTWPDFRAHAMLRRMYRRGEDADKVIAQLNAAGWSGE